MIGPNKLILTTGCLLYFSLAIPSLHAQENGDINVLELAKQKAWNGEFVLAIDLLQNDKKDQNQDVYEQQFLANIYYWSGNEKMAALTFEKAIATHPGQAVLHLDYGRMLFETDDLVKAKTHFLAYLKSDPSKAEAMLNLGYIYFWSEEYKTAESYFQQVQEYYPGQEEAGSMLAKIESIRSVFFKTNSNYQFDSQPLKVFRFDAEASQYLNSWLRPSIKTTAYIFKTNGENKQAQMFELGNQFRFKKVNAELSLNGGFYRNHFDVKLDWTGRAFIKKGFGKGFSLSAIASHEPSLATVAALDKLIFQNKYALQFDRTDGNSWMGQAALGVKDHGDQNHLLAAYAWAMTPAINVSIFDFRAGYAISYADAEESRFRSEKTLQQLVDNWQEGMEISGMYDPYFTPAKQLIHSVLANLAIGFTKKIKLELNGNFGFVAKANIPFLYLDLVENELGLATDFSMEKKHTYELGAKLQLVLSARTSLNGQYRYFKNFFYEAHTFDIGLQTNLNP